MRLLAPGESLTAARGEVVVCIPVTDADESTLCGVQSVVEHLDLAVPIILPGPQTVLTKLMEHRLDEAVRERLLGLVLEHREEAALVNDAAQAAADADIAIVAAGVVVGPQWLRRLRLAAYSDSVVASAAALSVVAGADRAEGSAGGSATVREWTAIEISPLEPEGREAAQRLVRELGERSLALHPRTVSTGSSCVYFRRAAWELAGPLQADLQLGEALSGLAKRVIARGMVNVVADDVAVFEPESTPGGEPTHSGALRLDRNEESCSAGADPLQVTIAGDERGSLRRALNWDRAKLRRMSVTIDGRALTTAVGGTQTYIFGVILALAHTRELSVRVLTAPDISQETIAALAAAPGVELLSYEAALRHPPLSDIVHRPQQVFTADDLGLLRLVGRRVVIGQQDLIAYHNYSYHPDIEHWRAYRRTTRSTLAVADQVVFFSEHARRDALAEGLLSERRAHVVGIGWETTQVGELAQMTPVDLGDDDPFLLCLGADYAHKNRPFAIALLKALRELDWNGRLVLAGSHVAHGSSRTREAELLRADPALAAHVLDLGRIDEPTKRWLYAHARALLYPTVYEGFGLLPLEAAHAELPCLFAAQASLAELAPDAATLTPWDASVSAQAVLPLLDDGPARTEHLKKLRSISASTWPETARELVSVYEQALSAPPPEAAARAWQELERESHIITLDRDVTKLKAIAEEYQDAYHRLEDRVRFGLPLIDRGGLLNRSQQRGLMRIASHGRLGALALVPFGLLGRGGGSRKEEQS